MAFNSAVHIIRSLQMKLKKVCVFVLIISLMFNSKRNVLNEARNMNIWAQLCVTRK